MLITRQSLIITQAQRTHHLNKSSSLPTKHIYSHFLRARAGGGWREKEVRPLLLLTAALPEATENSDVEAVGDGVLKTKSQAESLLLSPKQAFLLILAVLGLCVYKFLSSDAVELPEVPDWIWKLVYLGSAVAVSSPFVLKLLLKDRFHMELHRGYLYFQVLEVPPTGLPIPAGSVEVRPTGDMRGNGAYAVVPLSKGQFICNYEGELIDVNEYWLRYPSGVSDYVMRVDDEYALDASALVSQTANFSAVHMNHSRRPNVGRFYCRSQNRIAFFAIRDIPLGEELTIDYGRDFWIGRESMELP